MLLSEPEFVVDMLSEEIDYDEDIDNDDPQHGFDTNDTAELKYRAKVVIIATGVLGALLIIVVAAILCN